MCIKSISGMLGLQFAHALNLQHLMMTTHCPRRITPAIQKLCADLQLTADPEFLAVEASPDAVELDCFGNVRNAIARHGGAMIYGWRIWERTGAYIEAEFHATWQDAAGRLRDITPDQDGEKHVLFVRDITRTYQGIQVNNVRRALSDAPSVRELFRIWDEKFSILNARQRAWSNEVALEPREAKRMYDLDVRAMELMPKLHAEIRTPGRNAPCPCNSGLKYKYCCG